MNSLRFACGCQFDRNADGGINFSVDWDALNYDCPETWALLSAGNTQGVFQLESRFGQQTCKKAPIANVDELSNVVAALRPGCTQSYLEDGVTLSDHYLKRQAGEEEAKPFHPALEPILRGTQQISIYQEDILFISQEVAGFTAGEAYALMKGIAKKKPEIIAEFTQKFAEGCAKVGKVNRVEAEKIFEWIRAAQRYGFCKCLLPSTTVSTPSGVKTLDQLEVGDKVLAPGDYYIDEPNKLCDLDEEFVTVLNKFEQGEQYVMCIELDGGGEITCTLSHKFLASDGHVRSLKHILSGGLGITCLSGIKSIKNVRSIGVRRVVDIEIDNDHHLFYANGIATSNSHGTAYSYITYATAYYKAHFPHIFLASWMSQSKSKPKPQEEIQKLFNNAKKMNIEVYGPDVRLNNPDFVVKNGAVYFGLGHIKGVGEAGIKVISGLQEEFGPPESWTYMNLLVKILPKLKSNDAAALICSGAFDYIESQRTKTKYEFECLADLSKTTDEWVDANYTRFSSPAQLVQGILAEVKFRQPKSRKNTEEILLKLQAPPFALRDSAEYLAGEERRLLGVAITCSEVDACDQSAANCNLQEYLNGKDGYIIMAVNVDSIRETTIKKGNNAGRKMAFMAVSDSTCSVSDLAIFADTWDKYRGFLTKGNTVMLAGKRSNFKEKNLVVERVWQL